MTDALLMLGLGAMGVLAAWLERRDGWRYVALAERLDAEVTSLRERVAALEAGHAHAQPEPMPQPRRSWWPWGTR